jgi:hypothetical protein
VGHSTEVFVGIVVAKTRNGVAIADGELGREVRFLEVDLSHGELTAVWVPDEGHEAIRDLARARAAAGDPAGGIDSKSAPSSCSSMGAFPRKTAWGARHLIS